MRSLRSQRTGNSSDSPYSHGLVLLTLGYGLAPLWLVSRPLRNPRPAALVGRVELDPPHAPGRGHGGHRRRWGDGGRGLGQRGVGERVVRQWVVRRRVVG